MTPLAHQLAKILTLPLKDRGPWGPSSEALRGRLSDVHCFECTEVRQLFTELASVSKNIGDETFEKYTFLPAPKTWLEWRHDELRERIALCLVDKGNQWATVDLVFEDHALLLGKVSLNSDNYEFPGGQMPVPTRHMPFFKQFGRRSLEGFLVAAHWFLILINTPRIIGRRQFMPHAGLERKLLKKFGAGKFPLNAWHEIKLEVSKPIEIDDGEPHEAHLTGRRALHFCRAHLRVRRGQLEYVSSHWRGDPALGIKQTRYRLVA